MDGELYTLVHHTSGRQLITLANKLIKRQGGGGVIGLQSGRRIQLGLKAPHSVRIVGDKYWVCDSGRRTISIYNNEWELQNRLPSNGWGRGADVSNETGFFYLGISATRKRYRDRERSSAVNMVQVFRINDGTPVGEIVVPRGVEQINNVYIIPRRLADVLLHLS